MNRTVNDNRNTSDRKSLYLFSEWFLRRVLNPLPSPQGHCNYWSGGNSNPAHRIVKFTLRTGTECEKG